jgi:adenosylcobinamide-GDP ribazoletransferase
VRAALAFLTPLGRATAPGPRTFRWFPPTGLLIGAIVGGVWWLAGHAWSGRVVPAAVAVAADLAVTGLLHLDGLADAADGLLPHLTRERRLEVMTQPDVGAFAVAVVAAVLLLRFAALVALRPDVALVAGVWCASRSVMVLATVALPYARPSGLAQAFLGDGRGVRCAIASGGVLLGGAVAATDRHWAGVAAVVALVASSGAVLALARARIGGYTGDVLGAAAVVGETAALLTAAARW